MAIIIIMPSPPYIRQRHHVQALINVFSRNHAAVDKISADIDRCSPSVIPEPFAPQRYGVLEHCHCRPICYRQIAKLFVC